MEHPSTSWIILALVFAEITAIKLKTDVHHILHKRDIDGFKDLKHGNVHFYTQSDGLKTRFGLNELQRRKRDTGSFDEHIVLNIKTEDNSIVELNLHKTAQITKDTTNILFRKKDFLRTSHIPVADCFYTGSLKSDPSSVASVAICDHLEGAFTNRRSSYWFESLSTSEETDHEIIIGHRKDLLNIDDELGPYPADIDHEIPEQLNINKEENVDNSRRKRSVTTLTAETAVFVDEAYVNKLKALGFSTDAEFTQQILVRLHGMQAEWSKSDVLGYNMVIDIKLIEFWETDPGWYTVSSTLQSTLSSFCGGAQGQGTYANYDTLHLFTGVDSPDVSGKAFTGKVCVDGTKCAVSSYTRANEFTIPAHEFGHVMNMSHDAPEGCPSPNDGIMGNKPTGWSACSVSSMAIYLSGSNGDCLTTTDVSSSSVVSLQSLWPGMIYTDDEICEFKQGPGYRFRYYPRSLVPGECSVTSCIQMDPTAANYGTMVDDFFPTDGRYCDTGKVCLSEALNGAYQCITYAETGLNTSLITSVAGGWSAWGAMTSCSRTCGTGVQYRQRFCNNPKPQNSQTCTGDEYELTLCSTTPCAGDSATESTLIQQRAAETCAYLVNNGLFSSTNYQTTGNRLTSSSYGQCEVTCDPQTGFTVPTFQRFGLMPDGTPCRPDSQTFAEQHNLPITNGARYHCVQGYCIGTGCDGTPGNVRDRCGVCGGTNSTCNVVDEVFTNSINGDVKIYTLPTGAFNIYFYFDASVASMQVYFLEIWEGTTNYILSYAFNGDTDTSSNPRSYGGTDWYFNIDAQYLWAAGPTNREVDIWVTDFTGGNNVGIYYGYSSPASNATTTTGPTTTAGPTTTVDPNASTTAATTTTTTVTAAPTTAGTAGPTTTSTTAAQTTACATTSCNLSANLQSSTILTVIQISTIIFITHIIE